MVDGGVAVVGKVGEAAGVCALVVVSIEKPRQMRIKAPNIESILMR